MLDSLINFLKEIWERCLPWVVVPEWKTGIRVRFGHINKDLAPGFHWLWPFIDTTEMEPATSQIVAMDSQTLMTMDQKTVVLTCVVRYRVTNLRSYYQHIWEAGDAVKDIVAGASADCVSRVPLAELKLDALKREVLKEARKQLPECGVLIERVSFRDFGTFKTFRFITGQQRGTDIGG